MENVFRKIYIGINRAKVSKVENKGQVRKKRCFQVHTELFSDLSPLWIESSYNKEVLLEVLRSLGLFINFKKF